MPIFAKELKDFAKHVTLPILHHGASDGTLVLIAQAFVEFVDAYCGLIIYLMLLSTFAFLLNFLLKKLRRAYRAKTAFHARLLSSLKALRNYRK